MLLRRSAAVAARIERVTRSLVGANFVFVFVFGFVVGALSRRTTGSGSDCTTAGAVRGGLTCA
jgi:hypothetical protein